jgi:spore coat protein U-like protein
MEILIELDAGLNSAAGQRRMASNPVEHLTYDLYQDEANTVWGAGAQGMHISPTLGGDVELTVFGEVDPLQDVSADDYSDAIGVVLTIL